MTATIASGVAAKVRKFPCESCGADVQWNPGSSSLRCAYCGAERAITTPAGEVKEKCVEAALRAPRNVGWGAERKAVACKRCGAHTTLEPHVAATRCAFCGTNAVVEAPADPNIVRPEGLLAFRVPKEQAVTSFRNWLGTLWFRPNDLTSSSRLTEIQGVYVPFWTFDAATESDWTAEAGYYYYVTVQRVQNGRTVNVQERRVRWEHAEGSLSKFFDDVPVPASRGIDSKLAGAIEPYPTADLITYEPSYLAGFLAEENAIDLEEALVQAKERMNSAIRSACAAEVPGDTHRSLEVDTTFSALAYKNALIPIWIAAYDYRGEPYRYIVNGVTAKASGTAPWSWVKITLAIMAALIVAMVVLYAMGQ
jgi:LSD1 subclass zinc finger protein